MSNKYDDIIDLPHHVSSKHKRMSIWARSAQFAPFSALTGYSEAIKETARATSEKVDLDEGLKKILDNKLQIIKDKINSKPKVSFTYFEPDKKKKGGRYITVNDNVKKIDSYKQVIIISDNKKIPINDIVDITGDIFVIEDTEY